MPESDPESKDAPKVSTGARIIAGLIGAGFCIVLVTSLVTGDFSNGRIGLDRSSDPLVFWMRMCLFAVGAVAVALLACGLVFWKPPQQTAYVAHVRHKTTTSFAFLVLLGAAGSGYVWVSEWLENAQSVVSEMAGWIALGLLGLAAWPPVLPPDKTRTILRGLGTAAIGLAATMIYRLVH